MAFLLSGSALGGEGVCLGLGQTGTDWDWAAELCLYYGVLSGKGKTEVFECA